MSVVCKNTIDCNQGAVRSVRFNVDGSYCLTCGTDKKIKLWNPYRGVLLKTYGGHGDEVIEAVGSCDSSQILSGSKDKTIILWDVTTAQPTRRIRGHASAVTCVTFNETSTVAVSGSRDNRVYCWDIRSRSNEPIHTMSDAEDCITSITLSDYEILVTALDCYVRRYDLRNQRLVSDFMGDAITCGSFTRDGQCILVSCADDSVRLLDKSTGEMLSEYKGHKTDNINVQSCVNSSDTAIISGSAVGYIFYWDLVSATVLFKLIHTPGRAVQTLSMHPKNEVLLTASTTTVKLWGKEDIET